MSRNTRWKLEKTKVKVVFRLQFHATHIPQTGWNNLFISFIPSDSNKASAKTNKANVRNGTCKWADPIYETTRLLQDSKTKQYDEKLYKLVVAMGTSRSSLLGEANINLSDYVDASKPIVVTLPLHGSDSGAILHVTVQLLTSKTGFREFEQQREVSDRGLPANTDHVGGKLLVLGESAVSRSDKVIPRVRFKPDSKELPSLEEESGLSEGYADSATGFDVSSNTSGSLYTEKPDNSSTREIDSVKSTPSIDLGGSSTSQSPTMDKGEPDHRFLAHGTNDWIHQWGAENSVERDMTIVYEENSRLKEALEAADLSIHELRREIVSLHNFADGLSVETRNLTEQIAVEVSLEQNLANEVSMLKLECLRFKHDLEEVRNLKMNPITEMSSTKTDAAMSDTGLGVELCHPEGVPLPGLLTSGTHCLDASNEMQGEIFKLLRELDESKSERENLVQKMGQMECYYEALIQELEVNQKQLLGELQNLRHEHGSCIYTVSTSKAQMEAMHQQMNDELLQFDQERCNLDALNKELERRAVTSETALRRARLNYSIAVNQLQKDLEVLSSQVVSMYETNENLIRNALSEASLPLLHSFEGSNVDKIMDSPSCNVVLKNHHMGLDRSLEEELSEIHLQNLNLEVFSVTLHQALLEFSLRSRKEMHELAEELEVSFKSNDSLKLKLQNISDEICTLKEEKDSFFSSCNDLTLENQTLEEKLRIVSDENCVFSKRNGELDCLVNEYRDYKSKYEVCDSDKHLLSYEVSVLQEEIMSMNIKVVENEKLQKVVDYMRENLENLLAIGDEEAHCLLPCSKEYKNTDCEEFKSIITRLEDRLQQFHDKILQLMEENTNLMNERDIARESFTSAEAEVKVLKQEFEHNVLDKGIFVSRSNDLALENQTLEAKLRTESDQNCALSERIGELECLVTEYKNYKSKYEICDSDKQLLSNEVSLLQEEIMSMKIKVHENEKLKKVVNYMSENLENLLAISDEQTNGSFPGSKEDKNTDCEEFTSITTRLEDHLRELHDKIFQVTEEKTNLVNERDIARESFASVEAEVKVLKQGFEHNALDMLSKLNASNALLEKLQVDFEAVSNKVQVSSEAEEKCTQMTRDLLSDFTKMENALQELTLENKDLADMIIAFGLVTDELEGNKLTVNDLKQENLSLTGLLQNTTNESNMLRKELDKFKETVESLQDEIVLLRGIRDQLNSQILNLKSQLKEKDEKLGQHGQQLSDVESKRTLEENFPTTLEFQFLEMHGLLIASDIEQTVVEKQYKLHVEDLLGKLEYYRENLEEVEKKNIDPSSRLSNCVAGKENYAAEKATLLSDLDSLKSNLEYSVALNRSLEKSNSSIAMELKECEEKCGILETRCKDDKNNKFEIEELNCLVRNSQNEIEDLIFMKEELEIRFFVLQATIDEMSEEQEMLHKKCSELSRKLSEQILKAEEFKNLSIHLKEQLQAQEKKEAEKSSFASQESLRIAFIKEQYETKLQEIRHQLSISKKHGEEMLWKLQDALEELENRKKHEASQLKRNEEFLLRITELEAELQSALSDNREKFMEYEQLKAELDCSVMSLDCCKEEKNQLMVSLKECNDYKRKLADEVEMLKQQLENLKASMRREEKSLLSTPRDTEALATEATKEHTDLRCTDNDVEHNGNLLNNQLKPQFLLSSIKRLQKELEWMRSENTLLPGDDNPDELAGEVLQRDQVHLEKVSEELDNMSSLYNDSSRSGNSVERVLALEMELAEVLQAKKKSSSQFQSSFLKLHRDEAAIFQSFRDINELIKDMLEMKERHAAMETELKDMHDRYSQLSLDFAEVEGERQKLTMMLKNVRPSKRLSSLSPTSIHEELSS